MTIGRGGVQRLRYVDEVEEQNWTRLCRPGRATGESAGRASAGGPGGTLCTLWWSTGGTGPSSSETWTWTWPRTGRRQGGQLMSAGCAAQRTVWEPGWYVPPPGLRRAFSEASGPITSHCLRRGWGVPGRGPGCYQQKSLSHGLFLCTADIGRKDFFPWGRPFSTAMMIMEMLYLQFRRERGQITATINALLLVVSSNQSAGTEMTPSRGATQYKYAPAGRSHVATLPNEPRAVFLHIAAHRALLTPTADQHGRCGLISELVISLSFCRVTRLSLGSAGPPSWLR